MYIAIDQDTVGIVFRMYILIKSVASKYPYTWFCALRVTCMGDFTWVLVKIIYIAHTCEGPCNLV